VESSSQCIAPCEISVGKQKETEQLNIEEKFV